MDFVDMSHLLNRSCVYILLNGDEVIYVGQSIDIGSRVSNHRRSLSMKFDTVKVHFCPPHLMASLELELITKHSPKWNTFGLNVPRSKNYKIDLVELGLINPQQRPQEG